jgi:hypothetical protein
MRWAILITATIFFFACKPKEYIFQASRQTEYIQRLTPVVLPVETASADAILECSREGVVLLSKLNIETSRNAHLTFLLDSLGNLSVDAVVNRDTVYLPSDSTVITTDVVRTEIEYRDRELTWWQKVKQEAGGITVCIVALLVVYAVVRLILFIKKKFL